MSVVQFKDSSIATIKVHKHKKEYTYSMDVKASCSDDDLEAIFDGLIALIIDMLTDLQSHEILAQVIAEVSTQTLNNIAERERH